MVVGPAIGGAVSTHMGEQESFIFLHKPVLLCPPYIRVRLETVFPSSTNNEKYLSEILSKWV
jgi:hypothetical protein